MSKELTSPCKSRKTDDDYLQCLSCKDYSEYQSNSVWDYKEEDKMICERCELAETRKRIVVGSGHLKASYLIVGDGITRAEEALGKPFLGAKASILKQLFEKAGIELENCYLTNIILCRPQGKISSESKIACSQNIMDIYKKVQPEKVILIGKATQEFYGKTFPDVISIFNLDFLIEDGGLKSGWFWTCVRKLKGARIEEEKTTEKKTSYGSIGFDC